MGIKTIPCFPALARLAPILAVVAAKVTLYAAVIGTTKSQASGYE
jgi:hypothetical protein